MAVAEFSAAAAAAQTPSLAAMATCAWSFLSSYPSGTGSIAAIVCAGVIAVAYLATRGGHRWRRPSQWRRLRPWRLVRVLFSWRYIGQRSHTLDVLYVVFNVHVAGLLLGWMLLSSSLFTHGAHATLVAAFGPRTPSIWPFWLITGIASFVVFLAYEFGYWLDHYLSHRIPFLWEFHKVHHQAEVLSPLTNFRVHPVDSIVFINILALVIGSTNGSMYFIFGLPIEQAGLFSHHYILLIFTFLILQLQHSQIWIPICGFWGRIISSPAHHQIHHSTNPLHYDRNMGSCLVVFDWLFGTLHIPSRKREKLTFGAESTAADPHSLTEGLVNPFVRGWGHVHGLIGWLGTFKGKHRASSVDTFGDRALAKPTP